MANNQINYLQLIYRLAVGLIALWFLSIIWPYISNVILMLVFAFLFTTVLLSSVDALERKISHRGLSVLTIVMILIGGIGIFIGSFISQISQQAAEFSDKFTNIMPTIAGLGFIPSLETQQEIEKVIERKPIYMDIYGVEGKYNI